MEVDEPQEKGRPLEVRIDARDNAVVNMLDILAALASVQRTHTEIRVSFTTLSIAGYGPKEWSFTISDKLNSRYLVLPIGPAHTPYIIKKPLFEGSFGDIDGFISYMMSLIDKVLASCYTLYREPTPVTLNNGIVAEPQSLGFPFDVLLATNIPPETIHENVAPFCVARRANNSNY